MFEGAWIIRLNNNPGNKDVAKRLPAPQDYGLSRWSGSHILLRRRNKRYSAQKWSRKIQLSRRFVDLKFHQLSQIRYTRSSWRRLLLWQASTPKGLFSWDLIKQVVKNQGYKNEREHKCQTEGNISQLCRYARRVTEATWRQRKVCQSDRISVGTLIYSIMSGWNICCYSPLTKLRWAKPVQTRVWGKSHLATRKWTHTAGGIIVSRIQSAVFPLLSPCLRPKSVTHQSWKRT